MARTTLTKTGLAVILMSALAGLARAESFGEIPAGPVGGKAPPSVRNWTPQVIFGEDDRFDPHKVPRDFRFAHFADSVVSLFNIFDIELDGAGRAKLKTAPYGSEYELREGERFYHQPTGGECSGALVAPDLVLTAGHCITNELMCRNAVRFVFGFTEKGDGSDPSIVPASEVYSCAGLAAHRCEWLKERGADYALVRLDRPVPNHRPLRIDRGGQIKEGTRLFTIGHPSNLPTKIVVDGLIRDSSPEDYFVAELDAFKGSSGSAVFDARTGLILGVVVRGEKDFVRHEDGRTVNVLPPGGGRGEDIAKIHDIIQLIPEPVADAVVRQWSLRLNKQFNSQQRIREILNLRVFEERKP